VKKGSRQSFITLCFVLRHASALPLAYLKSNPLKKILNFALAIVNSPLHDVRVGFHALDCQAKIFWVFFFLSGS